MHAATEKFAFLRSGFPENEIPSFICLISELISIEETSYTLVAPGKSPTFVGSPVTLKYHVVQVHQAPLNVTADQLNYDRGK